MKFLFTGIRRRTKELRAAAAVTFLSALFLCGILLIQNVMNEYIMEQNRNYYGDWILCTYGDKIDHPYLKQEGFMTVSGAEILKLDGSDPSDRIDAGSVDAALADFGRLKFYEGHLPEKDDEIVMDRSSLETLGLSYELGQKINLNYVKQRGDPEAGIPETRITRTYTLCGVIHAFSSTWLSQEPGIFYPEILVTENELQQNYPELTGYRFYQLDPKYEDLNVKEFTETFINESTIYNYYVYNHAIWGDPKILRRVTVMMILVAVCAITCLLSSYTDGRKQTYYRLRSMGMSKGRLRGLILSECGFACAPAAAAGILIGYLLAFLVSLILSIAGGFRSFFRIDGGILLKQCAVIFGTVFISTLIALFRMNGRRISTETKDYGKRELRILAGMSRKDRAPEKKLLKRRQAVRPAARIASVLLTVIVTGFLTGAAWPMVEALEIAVPQYRGMNDFDFRFEDETVRVTPNYIGNPQSPFVGVTEKDREGLSGIFGIRSADGKTNDAFYHFILWDGMEDSEVLNADWKENEKKTVLDYGTDQEREDPDPRIADPLHKEGNVWFIYPDEAVMKRELKKHFPDAYSKENFDRWKNGELIYVLMNPMIYNWHDGENYHVEETTLKTGDTVSLITVRREELCDREIVLLDRTKARGSLEKSALNYVLCFTAFGSEAFLSDLEDIEGKKRRLNEIMVNFDENASYEATDKKVAEFANSHHASYYGSSREQKLEILNQDIIQPFGVYGSLFLMTFVIYLLLIRYFTGLRTEQTKDSYLKLKQIGMTNEKLKRMICLSEIRERLWAILGLVPGLFLIWLQNMLSFVSDQKAYSTEDYVYSFYSQILGENSTDPKLYGFDNILFCHGERYITLILLLIIVIVAAVSISCAVRKVKKEVLTHE